MVIKSIYFDGENSPHENQENHEGEKRKVFTPRSKTVGKDKDNMTVVLCGSMSKKNSKNGNSSRKEEFIDF